MAIDPIQGPDGPLFGGTPGGVPFISTISPRSFVAGSLAGSPRIRDYYVGHSGNLRDELTVPQSVRLAMYDWRETTGLGEIRRGWQWRDERSIPAFGGPGRRRNVQIPSLADVIGAGRPTGTSLGLVRLDKPEG